jgi:hypothetical protein
MAVIGSLDDSLTHPVSAVVVPEDPIAIVPSISVAPDALTTVYVAGPKYDPEATLGITMASSRRSAIVL